MPRQGHAGRAGHGRSGNRAHSLSWRQPARLVAPTNGPSPDPLLVANLPQRERRTTLVSAASRSRNALAPITAAVAASAFVVASSDASAADSTPGFDIGAFATSFAFLVLSVTAGVGAAISRLGKSHTTRSPLASVAWPGGAVELRDAAPGDLEGVPPAAADADRVSRQLDALEARARGVEGRLETLDDRMTLLEVRLFSVETQVKALGDRLDAKLDARFAALEESLAALQPKKSKRRKAAAPSSDADDGDA